MPFPMDSPEVELICHTSVLVEGFRVSLQGEDIYEVYSYSIIFSFVCACRLWRCELHHPVKNRICMLLTPEFRWSFCDFGRTDCPASVSDPVGENWNHPRLRPDHYFITCLDDLPTKSTMGDLGTYRASEKIQPYLCPLCVLFNS